MRGTNKTLREHGIYLCGRGPYSKRLQLRPMREKDWQVLYEWNNDPEVLYFAEGDYVSSRSMEDTQQIYAEVSQSGLCFIIELDMRSIGECWLQRMNVGCIQRKYPGLDCRRIDLLIGEKALWNRGIGTEVIRALAEYGFRHENADMIFGLPGSHNPRSIRAFEKAGFRRTGELRLPMGGKAEMEIEMSASRLEYEGETVAPVKSGQKCRRESSHGG